MKNKQNLIELLINLMMKRANHDITFADLLKYNIDDWYQKYTWTEDQEEDFREIALELIKENLKISKKKAKRELDWFILMYGLRTITELEYFTSHEFKEGITKIVNNDTWEKDLPKYYLDDTGWIVEHWKDGTINKLKEV